MMIRSMRDRLMAGAASAGGSRVGGLLRVWFYLRPRLFSFQYTERG